MVKRDAEGRFVEELAWSDLQSGGTAQPLTDASRDFRQIATLSGDVPFTMPNLSRIQPGLIGPVTDLLTFYADLFLASHVGNVREPGHRFVFPSPSINSWADGTQVLIGQGEIDFDITLTRVDKTAATATVQVKHVPPKAPKLQLPAEWMRAAAADVPHNWVQVRRNGTSYVAAAGKETFDVELPVSLAGGEILSASQVSTRWPVTARPRSSPIAARLVPIAPCGGSRWCWSAGRARTRRSSNACLPRAESTSQGES